jgi:hypothetical protein
MSFGELLAAVIGILEASGVAYMVTGSLASSYHGEPRATRDADVVIDPSVDGIARLVEHLLAAGFYVDPTVAHDAVSTRGQFNAIGPDATKVDFIVKRDRPFSIEEFGRRQAVDLLGTRGFIATAEDVVLSKLEWAKETGSERQLDDAAAIVAVTPVDATYIERWAAELGVEQEWRAIRDDGRA